MALPPVGCPLVGVVLLLAEPQAETRPPMPATATKAMATPARRPRCDTTTSVSAAGNRLMEAAAPRRRVRRTSEFARSAHLREFVGPNPNSHRIHRSGAASWSGRCRWVWYEAAARRVLPHVPAGGRRGADPDGDGQPARHGAAALRRDAGHRHRRRTVLPLQPAGPPVPAAQPAHGHHAAPGHHDAVTRPAPAEPAPERRAVPARRRDLDGRAGRYGHAARPDRDGRSSRALLDPDGQPRTAAAPERRAHARVPPPEASQAPLGPRSRSVRTGAAQNQKPRKTRSRVKPN